MTQDSNASTVPAEVRLASLAWVVLVLALLLSACGSGTPGTGAGGEPGQDPSLCEVGGFPCTLAEVDPAVRERSEQISGEYLRKAEADPVAAVEWLEQQPGVVDVTRDGRATWFRLEGGRPTLALDASHVLPPASAAGLRTDEAGEERSVAEGSTAVAFDPPQTVSPQGVVGRDRGGDGVIDNHDRRRALILDPLQPIYGSQEAVAVEDTLSSFEAFAYGYDVDVLAGDAAGPGGFLSLGGYDVVHVITEGWSVCADAICERVLIAGDDADALVYPGVYRAVVRAGGEEHRLYGVTEESFHAAPGLGAGFGLPRDAIVVLSADAMFDEDEPSLLAGLLADLGSGSNSVLGWDGRLRRDTIDNPDRLAAAVDFYYRDLFSTGLPSGDLELPSLALVDEQGGESDVSLRWFGDWQAGKDWRIREVVSLLDPQGAPLTDGADLGQLVQGVPGDGQDDRLDVSVQVDGVLAEEVGEYDVRFELDGAPLAKTGNLAAGRHLGGFRHELTVRGVPVGGDLVSGSHTLAAIVTLPEGGESRYTVDVTTGANCSWSMTFSGPGYGGTWDGQSAFVSEYPDGSLLYSFSAQERDGIGAGVSIFLMGPVPTDEPVTLTLGANNSDVEDGTLGLEFYDPTYAYPTSYGSGSGEPTEFFTYPPPMTLTLTVNQPNRLTGEATGKVWAWAQGQGESGIVTADLQLSFSIDPNAACFIEDPT